MASDDVARRLDEVRWSTEGLLDALRTRPPTDSWARQPSLLPGWTRGHVLNHLARNADAMVRTLSGTVRGEKIPMYDGEDARAADIEAGAGRPAAELAADVTDSAGRLEQIWSGLDDADWQHDAVTREGAVPAIRLVGMRWREVEIHRVDLADRYGPGDWPASFVAPLLPSLLDPAPDRTAVAVRAAPSRSSNTDSGHAGWSARTCRRAGTAHSARAAAVPVRGGPPVRVVGAVLGPGQLADRAADRGPGRAGRAVRAAGLELTGAPPARVGLSVPRRGRGRRKAAPARPGLSLASAAGGRARRAVAGRWRWPSGRPGRAAGLVADLHPSPFQRGITCRWTSDLLPGRRRRPGRS